MCQHRSTWADHTNQPHASNHLIKDIIQDRYTTTITSVSRTLTCDELGGRGVCADVDPPLSGTGGGGGGMRLLCGCVDSR